jgi:hypothetical protein
MKMLLFVAPVFKNSEMYRCFQEMALNFLHFGTALFKTDAAKNVKFEIERSKCTFLGRHFMMEMLERFISAVGNAV